MLIVIRELQQTSFKESGVDAIPDSSTTRKANKQTKATYKKTTEIPVLFLTFILLLITWDLCK